MLPHDPPTQTRTQNLGKGRPDKNIFEDFALSSIEGGKSFYERSAMVPSWNKKADERRDKQTGDHLMEEDMGTHRLKHSHQIIQEDGALRLVKTISTLVTI
ncbi:hypothetical protein RRG08_014212 [Elysia crispata]|uniref:Uncharacterized protein n=1 Tax=Elysia crispata TaxID=231223 RepID=A0AAE1CEZ2_9GAST|nr:hypothetical protein RRG08_014212 [Elysia crispata]